MTIIRYFLGFVLFLTTPCVKATDENENRTYMVTNLKFNDVSQKAVTCEMTFPTQEKSLNRFFLGSSRALKLSRSFKIGGTPSQIQLQDLKEESDWKILELASIKYEIHLKNVFKPIEGIIQNAFTPFFEKGSDLELGEYMLVLCYDGKAVSISFERI